MNIGFFVGSDIMSQVMMNELVPQLLAKEHRPFVFHPSDNTNRKARPLALEELIFFERRIVHEVIYPFLDSNELPNGIKLQSMEGLGKKYEIPVQNISSVNDCDFLDYLRREKMSGGVSLRCYQKFNEPIIDFFKNEGKFLVNLHPGILPKYRGVMTTIRAMANGEREHGYSLHYITKKWDAGPIISISLASLDCSRPMLSNNEAAHHIGVNAVLDFVNKVERDELISETAQDEFKKGYFSFPSAHDLEEYTKQGLRFFDRAQMCTFYLNNFSVKGTDHYAALNEKINKSIESFYSR